MLFIILHQEFALKTAHLIQHKDIRHKNYLNIVSGMNRRKMAKRGIEILYFILRKHCLTVLIVAIRFRNTAVMSR